MPEQEHPDDVAMYRYAQLLKAGFREEVANELAVRPDVDLHRACDLVRLCDPDVAARILV